MLYLLVVALFLGGALLTNAAWALLVRRECRRRVDEEARLVNERFNRIVQDDVWL